jgi:hypothetical protein
MSGRQRLPTGVPNPLDDRSAAQRGQREAGEITAEDETGHGRLETLDRHPQGNQGIKEAVGELDAARCDDQRPDLRAHRPARPHRPSPLSRPIRGFTPAEPIHAIRIRLPVEAVQGYRQGDGRDKSCQSAQLLRYHRGPDNRPRKESGSRPVPFLKTAPIINWPVCPW